MKRIAGCVFGLLLLARPDVAAAETIFYSIQVRAVSAAEAVAAQATRRMLRDRGYLAYSYRVEINGKPWVRVAVGVFGGADEAAAFSKDFSAATGLEHFVAPAPVSVTPGTGGDFVVTPSALWTREGGKAREVRVFDDPSPDGFAAPDGIRLKPSPDGRAVAFQYGDRVYVAALGDEKAVRIAGGDEFGFEHDYGPTPHWSASGRYIAFHDFLEFEVKTSLWVARADGSGLHALVDNRPADSQRALKAFVWHPTEDRVLFIESYAWGTVAAGGDIQSVDMAGNVRTVVAADKTRRQQLIGPLRIADGYLHYRKLEFDAEYSERTVTDAKVPVAGL